MSDGDKLELVLFSPAINGIKGDKSAINNIKIATLGPNGTSSEHAARSLLDYLGGSANNIILNPSFEQSYQLCLVREDVLLLFANAYAKADVFYMSPDLEFLGCFLLDTPSYGVAAKPGTSLPSNGEIIIASHHAPISLTPWFINNNDINFDIVKHESTAAAAIAVKNGDYNFCITNASSVKQHGLEFITRTRPIRMLWSFFGNKKMLNNI